MLLLLLTGLTFCTWDLNVNVTSTERLKAKSSFGHSVPSWETVPFTGRALNKYLWNAWGFKKVCHDYYNFGTVRYLQNTLFQTFLYLTRPSGETVRSLKEPDRQWESADLRPELLTASCLSVHLILPRLWGTFNSVFLIKFWWQEPHFMHN